MKIIKKILILGAGVYQVPLIKEAKKQGHYVIVASINGNYPGFGFADKVYYEDTIDKNAILKIAKYENIDAITTTGTDVAIETIGYVCEKLSLIGISEKTAILASNKFIMKQAFIENNVRTAKYIQVNNYDELEEAYKILNKPVILKIVDSSGSRGIIKIENFSQLSNSFYLLKEQTKQKYILIEECINGEEFGAQALIVNGKIELLMPHGDILFHSKTDVPIGHYVPYNLEDSVYNDLEKQIKNSIIALELKDCVINADFILFNNKIYVLEIGVRGGATNLPELTSIFYNINYYKIILDLALGKFIPYLQLKDYQACSSMLLFSNKDGILSKIDDINKDIKYYEFKIDYNIGEKVQKFEVGPNRIGHIVLKTVKSKKEEIVREIIGIANNIKIEVT